MSFLGSLGSSLIGTAASTLAGHWSAKQNASLSKDIWRYQQQNAHQFEVQDLRAAGLNPILSATNSQIAGMSSVSGGSVSDNGLGAAAINASSAKAMKLIDAEIEGKKLDNDTKRLGLEAGRLDLDRAIGSSTIDLNNSAKDVNDANVGYLNGKTENERLTTASEIKLRDKEIEHISAQIANEANLTAAQIQRMHSQNAVDLATIEHLHAAAKEAIQRSDLTYQQKLAVMADLDSETRKLENLSAKQRYDYLSTAYGNVSHQVGFGLSLVNPFGMVSFGKSGARVGVSN